MGETPRPHLGSIKVLVVYRLTLPKVDVLCRVFGSERNMDGVIYKVGQVEHHGGFKERHVRNTIGHDSRTM